MILILTGPTQSRKTTTLRKWCEGRTDCGGVLSPDIDGLRVLYNIKTKATIPWQHHTPVEGDSIVGRFSFDPNGFVTGYSWLNEHMADPEIRYIVLDEVGKLELEGKGWDTWLRSAFPLPEDKTLVLVIRRSLLDEIINRYQLEEVSVVDREYFT
jgi:nucleoside-triphosphatase THEP1